jgi:uncharacterized protein YllA (UPF0747 family)
MKTSLFEKTLRQTYKSILNETDSAEDIEEKLPEYYDRDKAFAETIQRILDKVEKDLGVVVYTASDAKLKEIAPRVKDIIDKESDPLIAKNRAYKQFFDEVCKEGNFSIKDVLKLVTSSFSMF